MRYLPLTDADREAMLARIGVGTIADLFADVPADKRLDELVDLPLAKSEIEVERVLGSLAAKNVTAASVPFFVGGGAYRHHVPASVDHLIQRSEFLTSYTPYQPEISQGTLQVLFEFQTQVANLTGMEVANASMYDGSTACAEAVLMAHRLTRRGKAVVSGGLHPQYRSVVRTYSRSSSDAVHELPPDPTGTEAILDAIDGETSCVVVQTPSFYGQLVDLKPIAEKAHENGALLVAVFTEAVAFGAVEPPGAEGADIVVGEGQSIGNPLTFGGPYVGLFATRQKFVRQMPGRLCGETVDAEGRRGFVLTLSTREQHIRRDKATSNICTNSGLCALAFSIHMTLLGETGLRRLAAMNHANAVALAESLSQVPGVSVLNDSFFNEFTVRLPRPADAVVEALAERGVLGGVPVSRLEPEAPELADLMVVAATEINSEADRAAYAAALKEVLEMAAALSLPGTGRGDRAQRGGWGASPTDGARYGREHAIDVLIDFIVLEAQDAKSVASELRIANSITRTAMLAAVDLDDEMMLEAHEIEDVAAVRALPPEVIAVRAPGSEMNPELHLMLGHRTAQPTGTVVSQRFLPTTPPTMLRMVPPPRNGEGLESAAALVAQNACNAEVLPC